ncbi:Imm8 family immunity protein [Corallococcus aberystwythensis]
MRRYDFDELWRWLELMIAACEGATWEECIDKSRLHFHWDFEGMECPASGLLEGHTGWLRLRGATAGEPVLQPAHGPGGEGRPPLRRGGERRSGAGTRRGARPAPLHFQRMSNAGTCGKAWVMPHSHPP